MTKTIRIVEEHPMSPEQQLVCDHICNGENVVVDACAGSGKSTTILGIAKSLPKRRFLQITYNAMLRKEFKEKVAEHGLTNLEVHTYHSLAVKYFSNEANTDTGIRHILHPNCYEHQRCSPQLVVVGGYKERKPPDPVSGTQCTLREDVTLPLFDVVVVDEAQDMTFLYYRFVQFVLDIICAVPLDSDGHKKRGRHHKVQLLVLGDYMQGIYEFKGADIRFLTLAHEIWSRCPHLKTPVFQRCTLKTSYRITRPMASFVNYAMLGCTGEADARLLSCRDGAPVVYIRHSRHNMKHIVVNQIVRLLDGGDLPSDIFILGPSVKGGNSMIRKIENMLVQRGIPCHVPMMENEKIDDRVIDGKIVFSTFHTVKGRQRKYVFVVGFDQSYFNYYAKNVPEDVCPNTLYVGCTRATHMMMLLECNDGVTDRPLPFLTMTHHDMTATDYIDFRGLPRATFYELDPNSYEAAKEAKKNQTYYVTPTELIKFTSETVLERITPILDRIFVALAAPEGMPALELDQIPTVVRFASGMYEDVADLNGIVLPCMYWDECSSTNVSGNTVNVLYKLIGDMIQDMKSGDHDFLKKKYQEFDPSSISPAQCPRQASLAPDTATQDYRAKPDSLGSQYLYLANMYVAVQEKLYFKLQQILPSEYNWLTEEVVAICKQRLDLVIGRETVELHEHVLIHTKMEEEHAAIDVALAPFFVQGVGPNRDGNKLPTKYRFTARLDMVTQESVWELKCCQQITLDHQLQVVIYAWLWRILHPECTKKVKIFNIKTGEILELCATADDLTTIVVELLRGKYEKPVVLTDAQFLEQCCL
jgi:AAA domain